MKTDGRASEKTRPKSRGGKFFPALLKLMGILVLLTIIVSGLALSVPRLFGYTAYSVVSGSMAPEIPVGSLVFVRGVEPEELQPGDVIAFSDRRGVVVHRVVENLRDERSVRTKGDANNLEDIFAVPYSEVLGAEAMHVPQAGRLLMLYSDTYGKLTLAGAAFFALLLTMLGDRAAAKAAGAGKGRGRQE